MNYTNSRLISNDPTNWYWFEHGFSNEEIQRVIEFASHLEKSSGKLLSSVDAIESYRKSEISWIFRDHVTNWLYEKIIGMANEANENQYGYIMLPSFESIQYTEYHEGGGHYDFHIDVGQGVAATRKLSITVQLSDPSEYDGGDFGILRGRNEEILPKGKGTVLVFPSFLLHRVSPVTRGTRRSLVMWLGGCSYR
jgi:PKHD-type hydroxylase